MKSASTSRAGGMGKAHGRGHPLLVVADFSKNICSGGRGLSVCNKLVEIYNKKALQ